MEDGTKIEGNREEGKKGREVENVVEMRWLARDLALYSCSVFLEIFFLKS